MANTPQSADNDDLQFKHDIDEVFSRANPNPDRIGCPPRDTLVRLARRQQPIGDPAYEHLAKCSPCYREFRALQEAAGVSTPASRGASRAWMLAAAAALVVVTAGTWWLTRGESNSAAPQVASAPASTSLRAELDLRKFAVLRSEQSAERQAHRSSLPTGVVELTLLLPSVQSLAPTTFSARLKSPLTDEATGTGAIENFVTTLRVRMDLRRSTPGRYQLAVRRQGDNWRMFPSQYASRRRQRLNRLASPIAEITARAPGSVRPSLTCLIAEIRSALPRRGTRT